MNVREFHAKVQSEHGGEIASRFYHNMVEWDGSTDVMNRFYDLTVMNMQLQFAIDDL